MISDIKLASGADTTGPFQCVWVVSARPSSPITVLGIGFDDVIYFLEQVHNLDPSSWAACLFEKAQFWCAEVRLDLNAEKIVTRAMRYLTSPEVSDG